MSTDTILVAAHAAWYVVGLVMGWISLPEVTF